MEEVTIFYSWQSEDKKTNSFISKALQGAIEDITKDGKFSKPLQLDRDTQGVTGSPHIVQTILTKIDICEVFVADVSLSDTSDKGKKELVNQNVMFELGYAIAKHTDLKVVSLFNEDTGDISKLPFDISHHRAHQFSIKDDKNGTKLRKDLRGILLKHLTTKVTPEIPGHSDVMYSKFKKDVADFLLNNGNADDEAGLKFMTARNDDALDDIEQLIMKIYGSMKDEKRILVTRSMDGYLLIPYGNLDNDLWKELEAIGAQEIVANLDALTERNLLTIAYSNKGTPSYLPTKSGLNIIKSLTNSSSIVSPEA